MSYGVNLELDFRIVNKSKLLAECSLMIATLLQPPTPTVGQLERMLGQSPHRLNSHRTLPLL
jgi:hypothetical protein